MPPPPPYSLCPPPPLPVRTGAILYNLMNSIGSIAPNIYFILLALFGSYFSMQLVTAILSTKFAELDAEVRVQECGER